MEVISMCKARENFRRSVIPRMLELGQVQVVQRKCLWTQKDCPHMVIHDACAIYNPDPLTLDWFSEVIDFIMSNPGSWYVVSRAADLEELVTKRAISRLCWCSSWERKQWQQLWHLAAQYFCYWKGNKTCISFPLGICLPTAEERETAKQSRGCNRLQVTC